MTKNKEAIINFRVKRSDQYLIKLLADKKDISISELLRGLIQKKMKQEKFN